MGGALPDLSMGFCWVEWFSLAFEIPAVISYHYLCTESNSYKLNFWWVFCCFSGQNPLSTEPRLPNPVQRMDLKPASMRLKAWATSFTDISDTHMWNPNLCSTGPQTSSYWSVLWAWVLCSTYMNQSHNLLLLPCNAFLHQDFLTSMTLKQMCNLPRTLYCSALITST